jgi:hypothetical protein
LRELNKDCEALIDLYGALQECAPKRQAERKKAFDDALFKFCGTVKANPSEMRTFVAKKWHAFNQAEARRKGVNPPGRSLDDPSQGKLDIKA